MKSVVLALLALVFTSTVHATQFEEKPLSHYIASATANTFNRIKTVGNYTKWIANRVPPDQMKDFKAYLKENGVKPSAKFPKMTAKNNSVCFAGTEDCFVFSDDSVTFGDAVFKVEQKPFRQVVEGACEKIGCSAKTAAYTLFPEAHAKLSRTEKVLLGVGLGAIIGGGLLAEPLGMTKSEGALTGAVFGGLGTYVLTEEQKYACAGSCQVAWQPDQCRYQMTPPRRPTPVDIYGQQQPPYQIPQQVYHQTYGQQHPPCDMNPTTYRPGPTDLQLALNTPQRPIYCNNQCTTLPPYQPPVAYNHNPGNPADVRLIQSEDKKK